MKRRTVQTLSISAVKESPRNNSGGKQLYPDAYPAVSFGIEVDLKPRFANLESAHSPASNRAPKSHRSLSPKKHKNSFAKHRSSRNRKSKRQMSQDRKGSTLSQQPQALKMEPNISYQSVEVETPNEPFVKGRPPARELEQVWDLFIEESRRRKQTHNLVKQLSKYPLLEWITVLVLEHHGIEKIFEHLRPCKSLIALYLKDNRVTTRDLVLIQHLNSLRKVDLSNNDIHFLPDEEHLSKLQNLEYLQLHKNMIVGQKQLQNLTALQRLRHITLQGNPCSKIKGYRQFLVDSMPQLRSIDEFIVMDFERREIARMFPPQNIKKHKLLELNRFRPFNKATNHWVIQRFKISTPVATSPGHLLHKSSEESELAHQPQRVVSCEVQKDFALTTDPAGINQHLKDSLYTLRRKFEYCSPILTIQKTVRAFIARRRYKRKQRMTKLAFWVIKRWYLRYWLERMMRREGFNRFVLFQIGRIRFIQRHVKQWFRKRKLRQKFVLKAQSLFRMRKAQLFGFDYALGLDVKSRKRTHKTLLFRKAQIELIRRIGLIRQAVKEKESDRFSIRSGLAIDKLLFRRSSLMNLVTSSCRFTRTQRARSLFKQVQTEQTKLKATASQSEHRNAGEQLFDLKKAEVRAEPSAKTLPSILPLANVLVEVTFANDFEVSQVIRAVSSYNRRSREVIQVFYEPLMRRLAASLVLQRWFRGQLHKRRIKPIFQKRADGELVLIATSVANRLITIETTQLSHFALLTRLARRIQRAWRHRCLRMRINALTRIAHYAAAINSKVVFLEQTVYLHLEDIVQRAVCAPWQNLEAQPSTALTTPQGKQRKKVVANSQLKQETVPIQANRFESFFEKRMRFEISAKDSIVHMAFTATVDKTGRYKESNLPKWFQKQTKTQIPKMVLGKRRQKLHMNILSLIHMTSSQHEQSNPNVVALAELAKVHLEGEMNRAKFIKIALPSIQEARNRAITLALLTANPRHSSDNFVRMFTKSDFYGVQNARRTYKLMRQYLTDNCLIDKDKNTVLAPDQVTKSQIHNGLIRKREEPYRTLLRAKPREKKTHLERFIVLGDADPKHVEERLGNALVSHQIVNHLKVRDAQVQLEKMLSPPSRTPEKLHGAQQPKGRVRHKSLVNLRSRLQEQQKSNLEPKPVKLTNSEIANLREKLKQNRSKIHKIEDLQRKLSHIKNQIEQITTADADFKSLFIKVMLPLLTERSKNVEVLQSSELSGSAWVRSAEEDRAIVIQMPRTDVNYFDSDVGLLSEENIDTQIKSLFEDYQRHKQAFRKAMNLSQVRLSKQNRTRVLSQAQSSFIQTCSASAAGSQLDTIEDRLPHKRILKTSRDHPEQSAQVLIRVSSPKKGASTSRVKLAEPAQKLRPDTLVLNKFSELQEVDKLRVEHDFRELIKSRSHNQLRASNLSQQYSRFQQALNEKTRKEFAQDFINKSNKLSSLALKSQSSANKQAVKAELQNQIYQQQLKKLTSFGKPNYQELRLPIKTESLIGGISKENNSSKQFRATPQKALQTPIKKIKGLPLKDSTSFIRKDSDVQRLNVQALPIEKTYFNNRNSWRSSKVESPHLLTVESQHALSQDIESKRPAIVFQVENTIFGPHHSPDNKAKYIALPDNVREVPIVNFQIPELSERTRPKHVNENDARNDRQKAERGNIGETSAKMKTKEILIDLEEMARAREIADLLHQQQQASFKRERSHAKKLFIQKNAVNSSSLSPYIEKVPKKVQKVKVLGRPQTQTEVPKQLQLAKESGRPGNAQATSIETIMRRRKQQEEKNNSIIEKSSGQADLQGYLLAAPNQENSSEAKEHAELIDHLLRSSRVFDYEKRNQWVPQQSLVGVSRTRSSNMFTSSNLDSKRKLSFLPSLTKKSQGKFTPLQ